MSSDKGQQKTGTAILRELRSGLQIALDEARQPPAASDLIALDEQLADEEKAAQEGILPQGAHRAPKKPYAPMLKDSMPPGYGFGAYEIKKPKA